MTLEVLTSQQSEWGKIVLSTSENRKSRFPYMYHVPSGEIYNFDPACLIRCKCFALTFATPFVSLIRSVYHLSKTCFLLLVEAFLYLDGQKSNPKKRIVLQEAAHDSVRDLIYGVSLTGYAVSGILFPYWGRQHYGRLERTLNRHVDGPHRDKFYMAFCFQPLYYASENFHQKNAEKAEIEKRLFNYQNRIDAICIAIKRLNFVQLMEEFKPKRKAEG